MKKKRNLIIAVVIVLILLVASLPRLTRSVKPYTVPSERIISDWGTVDQQTAEDLQAILDEAVNNQKTLVFQAYVRTADGKFWTGVSGTTDLARKIPLQRDDVIRIGSTTKTYAAVIVMQLVEAGQLDLDETNESKSNSFGFK
jgi:D-alanyl-D-alanine carboxypeptidase